MKGEVRRQGQLLTKEDLPEFIEDVAIFHRMWQSYVREHVTWILLDKALLNTAFFPASWYQVLRVIFLHFPLYLHLQIKGISRDYNMPPISYWTAAFSALMESFNYVHFHFNTVEEANAESIQDGFLHPLSSVPIISPSSRTNDLKTGGFSSKKKDLNIEVQEPTKFKLELIKKAHCFGNELQTAGICVTLAV